MTTADKLRSMAETFDGVADDCTSIDDVAHFRGVVRGLRLAADDGAANALHYAGVIRGLEMVLATLAQEQRDVDAEKAEACGEVDL